MKKILLFILSLSSLFSAIHQFDLIKKEADNSTTLFIIGGIHGNEPGGYFAPALMAQHYTINKGTVWIIPGLNMDSIVAGQRGIYKDMNRKFLTIDSKDADYEAVQRVKKLILDSRVDLILNLHDGHGFFRSDYKDENFNPKAWGQAFIIDQSAIKGARFGNLEELAKSVNNKGKIVLADDEHDFGVKNTNTKEQDKEMQKSLTYFAISNGKPALAIETSKNIKELPVKVFYQLQTIERFMEVMGIEFHRDFNLTLLEVEKLLADRGEIVSCQGRVRYDVSKLSSVLFSPLAFCDDDFHPTHPLVRFDLKSHTLFCGNEKVTTMSREFFTPAKGINPVIITGGKEYYIPLGSTLSVGSSFMVKAIEGTRVNIIGFSSHDGSETDVMVSEVDMQKKYALDKAEKTYRIEFYDGKKLRGSLLVTFD